MRRIVEALFAEGRPVYFSTQLAAEVAFLPAVQSAIKQGYLLEPVARVDPSEVYRLRKPEPIQ